MDEPPAAEDPGPPQGRPRIGRTAGLLLTAGAAAALALSPLATASSTKASGVPQAVVKLPPTAEALSPYLPQVSCDPVAKPGVVAFRALMLATYKRGTDGGITRACSDGGVSEHKEGRAWDWMLNVRDANDRAVAMSALGWLLAAGPHAEPAWNARRLGVMYIIWDAKIWGAYRPGDGWRPYTGPSEHTDHVHFSFSWAGAQKRTSWWTGKVAAVDYGPCQPGPGALAPVYRGPNPSPCPVVTAPLVTYAKPGDSGAHVRVVQLKLGVRPVSGFFGDKTVAAVKAYQKRLGLTPTGVVDGWTAYRLGVGPNPSPAPPGTAGSAPKAVPYAKPGDSGAHVRVVQLKLGVRPVSGFFGDKTLAALKAYQKRLGLTPTGVVDGWTAYRLRVGPNPSPPPPKPVPYAKPGDTGAHVRVVQLKLGVRPVSGFFGDKTVAALKAYQKRLGLTPTGVVDGWTAYRLGVGPNPSPPPPAKSVAPYAKPGDNGARVKLVQTKLGVRPATGYYGPRTVAAVNAFQHRWRLPQTGVVDHATAVRLGLVRA